MNLQRLELEHQQSKTNLDMVISKLADEQKEKLKRFLNENI